MRLACWCSISIVVLALSACGPSTKDVETAKTARYKAPVATVFALAHDATKATFKIDEADPERGALITIPKWYSPDGQAESAGVGNAVQVEDGSMLVALLVEVAAADDSTVRVTVTPVVERFRLGVSQHEKLRPDDPSLPGWVHGKAEALLVSIHARAKQYAAP